MAIMSSSEIFLFSELISISTEPILTGTWTHLEVLYIELFNIYFAFADISHLWVENKSWRYIISWEYSFVIEKELWFLEKSFILKIYE